MVCGPLLYLKTINSQNWKYPNHDEDHELIGKIGKIADLSEIEFQCTLGHDQHLAAFAMLLFLCRIVARLPAVRQGRSQLADGVMLRRGLRRLWPLVSGAHHVITNLSPASAESGDWCTE